MRFPRLAALLLLCGSPGLAADLPRSSPEAQGASSPALLDFVEAADRSIESMNSLMVLRHGQVIAEGWWKPYAAGRPHSLYSLSKSFTSTAIGLAIAEGKLSLDDEVLKFFPEDAPAEPTKNLKAMRVSDLLRMSAGHQDGGEAGRPERSRCGRRPSSRSPSRSSREPTSFTTPPATYMLSAIVQKVTGQTVLDYLRPRSCSSPLGIARSDVGH